MLCSSLHFPYFLELGKSERNVRSEAFIITLIKQMFKQTVHSYLQNGKGVR